MWRLPVTFGGGIMMVNGALPDAGSAWKAPSASQPAYRRGSTAA